MRCQGGFRVGFKMAASSFLLLSMMTVVVSAGFSQIAQMSAEEEEAYRNTPAEPFRIIGNIYHVGPTLHITSYLIRTTDGLILLDTGYEKSVPAIRENVEKLGFNLRDVRIMLNSHAHGDHVAGHARMKELTGARVLISKADSDVVESGGRTDFRDSSYWTPAKVDSIIEDGETVRLGDVSLTAHLTPGHTKGCTTWTTKVEEGGKEFDVVFFCGLRLNPGVPLMENPKYPDIVQDFDSSIKKLRALPIDVFLGAHGYWFGLQEKYPKLQQRREPNPFIDPAGYRALVDDLEKAFLDQLRAESGTL
jgi:metallo-beta-lactamase class B